MTRHKTRPTRMLFTLIGGLSAFALTACGTGVVTSDTSTGSTLTIENCGNTVVVPGVPTAAVGMHPSQTELLLRLGLVDHLVGQAQATVQELAPDIAPLAADIPVIGGATPPSREDLLAVEPDFVYAPTTYEFTAEQGFASIEQLHAAGATTYVATGGCFERRMEGTVDDLFLDIENLGDVFQVQDQAAELISESQAQLAAVESAIKGKDKPRAAQIYVDGTTLSAIGAGVEYDIMRRAGAEPVFTPEDPAFADFFAAEITPESLAAQSPDVLVFGVTDDQHETAVRSYLTTTFPDMPAVRDGRLVAVPSSDLFPGTLGNVAAVEQIAKALYPTVIFD
jgi:iron complex transport system substrate-binding protein